MSAAADTLVLFMDRGIIAGVYTLSGEPLPYRIVTIDYDEVEYDAGPPVHAIPQGDGRSAHAWVGLIEASDGPLHPAIAGFVTGYVADATPTAVS